MKNHYLQAPETSTEQTDTFLPDRTNLSMLYVQAKPEDVTAAEQAAALAVLRQQPPVLTRLFIALAIPLPFLSGFYAVQFLIGHVHAGNIYLYLPFIIIGGILWLGWLFLIALAISKRLTATNLSLAPFVALYSLCLIPLAHLVSAVAYSMQPKPWADGIFLASLFGLSFLVVNVLFHLVAHEAWSSTHKKALLLSILAIGAAAYATEAIFF